MKKLCPDIIETVATFVYEEMDLLSFSRREVVKSFFSLREKKGKETSSKHESVQHGSAEEAKFCPCSTFFLSPFAFFL